MSFNGGKFAKMVRVGGHFDQIHAFRASNVSSIITSMASSSKCSCCKRRIFDVTPISKKSVHRIIGIVYTITILT